ncbi:MAG: hypothetical protein JNM66_31080, partial [Bryobacterales bacterium]|nr:hypothetical protein [Bryobacterales bacterium]
MNNAYALCLLLVAGAGSFAIAADYERKPDRASVAGLMLEEIDLQPDATQRLSALEAFVARYPKHPSANWAWDQIRSQAVSASQWDKVAAISQRMLEANPEDSKSALVLLDAAERANDPAKLIKALEIAETVAELVIADKTRASKDDAGKQRLGHARTLAARAEATRLKVMVQDVEPSRRLALLDGFDKRYPNSPAAAVVPLLKAASLWMLSDAAARPAAQQAAKSLPESEDALFLSLASTIAQEPEQESVAAQALWLLETLQRKPKPACAPDADWNRKRDAYLRTSHVALALSAGLRGDFHLARRGFSAASAYAEGNATAVAALA